MYLLGAFVLSAGVHLLAFMALGVEEVDSAANRQSSRIEVHLPPRPDEAREILLSEHHRIKPEAMKAAGMDVRGIADQVGLGEMRSAAESRRILRMPSELDSEPVPLNVPDLEPDYGFADDVGGTIVLSVLIGRDGSVNWLYVESSEATPSATEYVTQMFRLSRFEIPTFLGVPVMTLTKIQVVIPPLHSLRQ